MIEGELTAVSKAWECQKAAGIDSVPVALEKYLATVSAELQVRDDLEPDEAGQCFQLGPRRVIWVNGHHSPERQRFTVLHEIAHLYLNLPSQHGRSLPVDTLLRYSGKPREEILCDVFAAECLFPRLLFTRHLHRYPCGLQSIQTLAEDYGASLTATGSRFAAYTREPCAWVLADDKRVRYVSSSATMRDARFWIQIGNEVPKNTVLGRLITGTGTGDQDVVPYYAWTNSDCPTLSDLYEEAILVPSLSQGLSIIWAEDIEERERTDTHVTSDDDELLPELDGQLRFGKRTRHK
jgi:hypothetical protein